MRILVFGDFQGNFPEKLKRKISKEKFDLVIGVGDYSGLDDWRPWIFYNLKASKEGSALKSAEDFFGKKKYLKLISKEESCTKKVLKEINSLGKKAIIVFGNGDDRWYNYKFERNDLKAKKKYLNFVKSLRDIKNITYSNLKLNGVDFLGFGGYMDIDSYFDKKVFKEALDLKKNKERIKRREQSRQNLFERYEKVKGESVLVLHYPPKGVFDIIKSHKANPMNGKSAGIGFFREAILKYKPRLVLCGHMHEYRGAKKLGKSIVVNPGDGQKGNYAIIDYSDKIRIEFK